MRQTTYARPRGIRCHESAAKKGRDIEGQRGIDCASALRKLAVDLKGGSAHQRAQGSLHAGALRWPYMRPSPGCTVFRIRMHRLVLRAHCAMNLLDRVHGLLRDINFLSEFGDLRLNARDSLHVSFNRINH
jgi:hypothetical protein